MSFIWGTVGTFWQIYRNAALTLSLQVPPIDWGLRSYKADSLIWDDSNECCHEWVDSSWKNPNSQGGASPKQDTVRGSHHSDYYSRLVPAETCRLCGAWRGQLGSEPDPDLFCKHLCDIFDLCKPVLKKTGSLWVNLDDSMAGSNCGYGDYRGNKSSISIPEIYGETKKPQAKVNIPAKSLCAIPERFVLKMLEKGWIYRQCIIWQKPSCMPESVKDRMTRDFEYLYHFTQQGKYFFERQFEPAHSWGIRDRSNYRNGTDDPLLLQHGLTEDTSSLGRNKRSVWSINPEPQKAVKKGVVAHYAAFPTALCTIPILATVPEQICTKCGMPRVKIYDEKPMQIKRSIYAEESGIRIMSSGTMVTPNEVKEIGLSDCGCGAPFEPGTILDPFAGTGSVAVEARKLGRKAVLIEVSESYAKIIEKRLESVPLPLGV